MSSDPQALLQVGLTKKNTIWVWRHQVVREVWWPDCLAVINDVCAV